MIHIRDYQGKRVHMIGIGGSSMSGLAQMLLEKGYRLTGSDNLETYATKHLRNDLNVPVTIGHKAENVHGADLVVYTVAILPDNPERVEMERLGIPNIERVLERLTKMGAVDEKTIKVINHFSHNANPLQHILEARVNDKGWMVAYDGFSIEL